MDLKLDFELLAGRPNYSRGIRKIYTRGSALEYLAWVIGKKAGPLKLQGSSPVKSASYHLLHSS